MDASLAHFADTLFRAFDLRIDADTLTTSLALRLIHAHACYFREQLLTNTVVLCRDARLSGNRMLQQAVDEFVRLGFQVFVNPLPISTCQFYYLCMRHSEAAGIMYSASHNPGHYTGQKIVGPQVSPIASGFGPAGGLDRIKHNFLCGETCQSQPGGQATYAQSTEDYVRFVMGLAGIRPGDLAGLRILCDYLSGSAGLEIALAFKIAGADTVHRNSIPDGAFPSGDPNPVIHSSIKPMVEQMKRGGFDFGLCFDGDGDRMDVLDSQGRQLSPSLNFSLISDQLKRIVSKATDSRPPHAFLDPKASPFAYRELSSRGIAAHLVKNGHSIIKALLISRDDVNFIGAVEESAHYYIKLPNPFAADGYIAWESTLLIALLVARCWIDHPEAYHRVMQAQLGIHRQREWAYRFIDEKQRMTVLAKVAEAFENRGAVLIDAMDTGEGMGEGWSPDSAQAAWLQVSQRRSESEEGIARWEVMAGTNDRLLEAIGIIERVVTTHSAGAVRIG